MIQNRSDTIFNVDPQPFKVGQPNIRHKDYGSCEIVSIEPWKGKTYYYIRMSGSSMKVLVTGSKLEVIPNELS